MAYKCASMRAPLGACCTSNCCASWLLVCCFAFVGMCQRPMQAHLKCDMLCWVSHKEHYRICLRKGVNSYFQIPLPPQLDCHLSASLHPAGLAALCAWLCPVSWLSHPALFVSSACRLCRQLQSAWLKLVSSAVNVGQLTCNLSALLYSGTECCSALFSFYPVSLGSCAVMAGAK